MEPILVEESEVALEDAAAKLLADANGLAKRMHPILRESVGTLVRSMNCSGWRTPAPASVCP